MPVPFALLIWWSCVFNRMTAGLTSSSRPLVEPIQ